MSLNAQLLVPKKGFTLIELLVVISIIGLLASIVLASLKNAKNKAAYTAASSDIRVIDQALELYYQDHNDYPPAGGTMYVNTGSNGNWNSLAPYLLPYLKKLSVPIFPSIAGSQGVIQGYVYSKGTEANPITYNGPVWNGTTNKPVACVYVYSGFWLDSVMPEQSVATLNDGGPDPDGYEVVRGHVKIVPTNAWTCP